MKDDDDVKGYTIQFRVNAEQRRHLIEKAESEADTLSNWCRRNVLIAAGWRPLKVAGSHN